MDARRATGEPGRTKGGRPAGACGAHRRSDTQSSYPPGQDRVMASNDGSCTAGGSLTPAQEDGPGRRLFTYSSAGPEALYPLAPVFIQLAESFDPSFLSSLSGPNFDHKVPS